MPVWATQYEACRELPWCWQTIDLLKIRWQRKDFTEKQYQEVMDELNAHRVWDIVPPEQPYGTIDALLEAEIGCSEQEAKRQLVAQATGSQPQGGRPETDKLSVLTQGTSTTERRWP